MDSVPLWALLVGTMLMVLASIEAGYRLGRRTHLKSSDEKESPVSALSFALIIVLIASLDRPDSTLLSVSQQPYLDALSSMQEPGAQPGPGETNPP